MKIRTMEGIHSLINTSSKQPTVVKCYSHFEYAESAHLLLGNLYRPGRGSLVTRLSCETYLQLSYLESTTLSQLLNECMSVQVWEYMGLWAIASLMDALWVYI